MPVQYRADGTAFEAKLTVIPVFDWLSEYGSEPSVEDDGGAAYARQMAVQALDYGYGGADLTQCAPSVKDRLVMNPSYFVARLEEVPPPPPRPRVTPTRYLDEDGVEYLEGGDPDDGAHSYPPLTPQQMHERDHGRQ